MGRAVIGFGGTKTRQRDKKVNNDGVVNNSGATPHSLCNDLNDYPSIFRLLDTLWQRTHLLVNRYIFMFRVIVLPKSHNSLLNQYKYTTSVKQHYLASKIFVCMKVHHITK